MLPYLLGYLILSSLVFHVLMFRRLVMMIYRMCILKSSRMKLSTKNQTKLSQMNQKHGGMRKNQNMEDFGTSREAALPPSGESSAPDQMDDEAMLEMARSMMSAFLNTEENDV